MGVKCFFTGLIQHTLDLFTFLFVTTLVLYHCFIEFVFFKQFLVILMFLCCTKYVLLNMVLINLKNFNCFILLVFMPQIFLNVFKLNNS